MMKGKMKLHGRRQVIDAEIDLAGRSASFAGERYETGQLVWDVPVTGTVYGTLLNYKGELAALGDAVHEAPYKAPPRAPVLYVKPANTLIGHGMPIPLPAGVERLAMGAALGLVIGRTATRVSEAEALAHVAGYTVVNDVSIPHESVYRPAVKEKARDGFCPVGPWVAERDAVADPDGVELRVYVNDELRQTATTADLLRPAARLLADVTEFMTLSAGDVLLVGVPAGAPLAGDGDRVRIEVDGVGVLENPIVGGRLL
ncbi:MAG TPA: fumarylacetoacetate hydrolase family protein [Bacillales bacterium]|nr:fumarylacetoacetate hydrolase family protein [Bacillales bacterium]